jgi:hypothetical protein
LPLRAQTIRLKAWPKPPSSLEPEKGGKDIVVLVLHLTEKMNLEKWNPSKLLLPFSILINQIDQRLRLTKLLNREMIRIIYHTLILLREQTLF